MRKIRLVVSVLVVVSWSLALSAEGESNEADPFFRQRGIDDRAAFFVVGINSRADTTAHVNSEVGIGSTLLLERLFDLPRERDYPRFQGYYRFSRKHRLDLRYLQVSASGTNTLLDEEITVGPLTFELGAAIGATQKTRFGAVEYRYAFVNDGRAEAGLSAGLGIVDLDLEIFGEIGIIPGPSCRNTSELFSSRPHLMLCPVISLHHRADRVSRVGRYHNVACATGTCWASSQGGSRIASPLIFQRPVETHRFFRFTFLLPPC
jgi:hypothetical protein